MIWEHKTAPELQLMSTVEAAQQFNRERGSKVLNGPTIRFSSKDPPFTPKELSTVKVQQYTTKLGEKRTERR
jgi:hypothetical protein